ncbi:MAG TPA: hypothetical protein DD420_04965 [Streptomyces sp.]|nr:hypothetical protein [Streptomyces sp.]
MPRWLLFVLLAVGCRGAAARGLEGVVLEVEGQPRPGAEVVVLTQEPARGGDGLVFETVPLTADEQGRFVYDQPYKPGVEFYVLGALARTAEGYGLGGWWEPTWRYPAREYVPQLLITASVSLRGEVVDSAGNPLPGATLTVTKVNLDAVTESNTGSTAWINGARTRLPWPATWPPLTTTTDEAGRWQLDGLPRQGFELAVRCPGYAGSSTLVSQSDIIQAPQVTVALARAGSVAGRVLTPAGEPVADLPLRLESIQVDEAPEAAWTAQTDAQGRYRFDGVWTGSLTLRSATATADAALPFQDLRLEDGQALVLPDIAALPTRPLTITARDAATGEPLPGVTLSGRLGDAGVRLTEASSPVSGADGKLALRTSVDGYQLIALPPPGWQAVGAEGGGLGGIIDGYLAPDAPAPPAPIDVAFERTRAVRGRVVEEGGAPLAGLEVSLERWTPWSYASDLTDDQGRFELANVPLTGSFEVYCQELWGYQRSARTIEAADLPADEWLITLPAEEYAPLTGRIVDAAGQPVADVEVLVKVDDGPFTRRMELYLQTDADGRFTTPPVPVELAWYASVDHPDVAPRDAEPLATATSFGDIVVTVQPGAGAREEGEG